MPQQEQTTKVKPWDELQATFDPMMPQETYEGLRKQYFFSFVAPRLRVAEPNVLPDVQFEEWKKRKSVV